MITYLIKWYLFYEFIYRLSHHVTECFLPFGNIHFYIITIINIFIVWYCNFPTQFIKCEEENLRAHTIHSVISLIYLLFYCILFDHFWFQLHLFCLLCFGQIFDFYEKTRIANSHLKCDQNNSKYSKVVWGYNVHIFLFSIVILLCYSFVYLQHFDNALFFPLAMRSIKNIRNLLLHNNFIYYFQIIYTLLHLIREENPL